MRNDVRKLKTFPFFLFLLPAFFVLHGYTRNFASVTLPDLFTLTGEYLLATAVLFLIGFLLYRKWHKAALFSFGIMFFHLFFGAFHDSLKKISPGFLAKYSVLLPLVLMALIAFILVLKKVKDVYPRFFAYLNLIFVALILIDVPTLLQHKGQGTMENTLPVCDSCRKPDIYLLVADEYADSISLTETLHFNNNAFLASLRSRGFHVMKNTRSNYNFTPFAAASLLKMDYLQNITGSNSNGNDRNICTSIINQNRLLAFFTANGYAIKNFSIFNVADQPTQAKQNYVLMGKDLIVSQTFLQRMQKDLGYHLVTTLKWKWAIKTYLYYTKECNEKLLGLLQNEIKRKSEKPRFVYTHLLMPHYPYYYDKNGNERPFSFFQKQYEFDTGAYLEYLQYSNGIFLQLIDDILKNSANPPIILFMGDHGFREYPGGQMPDQKYFFMNLNSVYLPDRDYSKFYDGISTVNEFRALLNTTFNQHLPLLKDSSILVRD